MVFKKDLRKGELATTYLEFDVCMEKVDEKC